MEGLTRGWSEPVSIRLRLQTCLKHLARGRGNTRERWTKATFPLVGLGPEDFPEQLRGRAKNVLSVRSTVAQKYETDTLYRFDLLTPKRREEIVDDIIALYEACLIDLGRLGEDYDFTYPSSTREVGHTKRRRR